MGQLFGSVTSRDIAEAISEAGFVIKRNQVIMDRAIKTLGLAETRIRLHPEVSVTVIVNIARSLAEAETQLKTGVAVTGENATDDAASLEAEAESEAEADLTSEKTLKETVPVTDMEAVPAATVDAENDQAAD